MDTTDPDDDRPVVLAVDDEERVVQAFALWLEDYEVHTATGGEEALDTIDDSVDVVLLDRHMPHMSGDEVLDEIREGGYDCRVAMVTGVDPDFDIVDMPFEEYVQKPVDQDDLTELIDRLVDLERFDESVDDLYAVIQKRITLEAELPESELEDSDRYQRLLERERELEAETDDVMASMDDKGFEKLF